MPLPLIPLALGAGAVWYLLTQSKDAALPPGTTMSAGKITGELKIASGQKVMVTTTPQVYGAMRQAVSTNSPSQMATMAAMLDGQGYHAEAQVMQSLAKALADYQKGMSKRSSASSRAAAKAGKSAAAAAKKASTKPANTTAAAPTEPGAALLREIQAALNSGNPATMRAVATALRSAGFAQQAAALEGAANALEASQRATPARTPTPVIAPAPSPTPAPVITAAPVVITPTVSKTPRRATADALVRHLTVSPPPKKKEDQDIVRAYQTAAGLKVDGLYGPGTAKSLADSLSGGHVPPSPRRWPAGTYYQALSSYKTWLASKAASDPARADEWNAAKAKAKEYWP